MKTSYRFASLFTSIICILFFIFYFRLVDYGLPYFDNFDENAHIKGVTFFYGFFSDANQNIVGPIYSPFIHFLITGTIFFIKFIIFLGYSTEELKELVYLNPDLMWSYTRLSSLIVCTLSLYLIFLILKKLKISNILISAGILSISLSFFLTDISISAGKNSNLLLLFLIQYYLFLKYFFKINKFNLKSYIYIGIISSLAWGINYWAATPGIYSIIILHHKKFNFSKISNIGIYFLILVFLGILLNFLVSGDNILHHLYNPDYLKISDYTIYSSSNRFIIFFEEFINGIKIIRNYESNILEIVFILIISYFTFKNFCNNKIVFFNLILIFEPLLLFSLADYSHPAIRYFGPSICLIYITIFYIIENLKLDKIFVRYFISALLIISILIPSYNKIKVLYKMNNILKTDYIQYEILHDYENYPKTIYRMSNNVYRENILSLNLYEELLNLKLVRNNPDADGKNTKEKIFKKIDIINKAEEKEIYPSSKGYIFLGGEFLIDNQKEFFRFIDKKYDFYVIDKNNKSKHFRYLLNNYKINKIYKANDITAFRQITLIFNKQGYKPSSIDSIKKIGNTFVVFDLKNKL